MYVIEGQTWTCLECTFVNAVHRYQRAQECELCGVERSEDEEAAAQANMQSNTNFEAHSQEDAKHNLDNKARQVVYQQVSNAATDRRSSNARRASISCVLIPFICPITCEMMDDPVLTVADGHTYEREAITKWFGACRNALMSPSTGMKLDFGEIIPNHALHKLIQHFVMRRPELRRHKYINEMEVKKKALASVAPLGNSDLAKRINNTLRAEAGEPSTAPRTPREILVPPKSPLQDHIYNDDEHKIMNEIAPTTEANLAAQATAAVAAAAAHEGREGSMDGDSVSLEAALESSDGYPPPPCMPTEDIALWLQQEGFEQFAEALARLGIEQVPDVQDLDWDDLVMLVGMSTDEATALMEQADVWVEEETRYVEHREREEECREREEIGRRARRTSAHKLQQVRRVSYRYAAQEGWQMKEAMRLARIRSAGAAGSEEEEEEEGGEEEGEEEEQPVLVSGERAINSIDEAVTSSSSSSMVKAGGINKPGQLNLIDIDVDETHDLALQLLLCPITMEIMVDPVVVLVDGQVLLIDSVRYNSAGAGGWTGAINRQNAL
jgi:hypothetical protein